MLCIRVCVSVCIESFFFFEKLFFIFFFSLGKMTLERLIQSSTLLQSL